MVNKNLVDYIKDGLKKGYSKEELKKILKENNWSDLEVLEAFEAIEQEKQKISKSEISQNNDQILNNFINSALSRGFSVEKIKQALIEKKWPIEKIEEALAKAKKPEEKPIKEKKKVSIKKIFLYILWFFVIGIVLSVAIGVFYYIQGMNSYVTVDPSTNQQISGKCLKEDCSDMKEYIHNKISDKSIFIITIALSIALVLILLYIFIPNKELIIWIANILFFLYILYLLYLWLFAR
jgi:SOS response regulatory protein OraA/RecX